MRIKHFAGYGCVIATKIRDIKIGENTRQITIKVTGNHERGLVRRDYYDIYNWLVKRFCNCMYYNCIQHIEIQSGYERINDIDTEFCIYTINYEGA